MLDLGPLHACWSFVACRLRGSIHLVRRPPTLALAALLCLVAIVQGQQPSSSAPLAPPRVLAARRFLAQRGNPSRATVAAARARNAAVRPRTETTGNLVWQPLGPAAILTPMYGLVSGRVTAATFDPSDPSGNHVYIGTTGGGVWSSQNAASTSLASIQFDALTDNLSIASTAAASISIGALSVQPTNSQVVLAGTGDPNDALDSYYGAGILRSTDGGSTWSLISTTADQQWSFAGEALAAFAWSTPNPLASNPPQINPQLVVAAVTQARDGSLTDAQVPNGSYAGLYYSTDAGAHWSLAVISDGATDVQGPLDVPGSTYGNGATSVVWNPVRGVFVAAVQYHGYYQSTDGIHFTRIAAQPGSGLYIAAQLCPTDPAGSGSIACPIARGTLAVNPATGDTFAWTVDANNQDQGIWQDKCAPGSSICSNPAVAFTTQISTTPLQSDLPLQGPSTIANGDYNLVLAAIPSAQDTLLFAGANDLWKCSLAAGCIWRNTTNAATCMSAQVGEYQHALAWNLNAPMQLLIGNDSGLWNSSDDIGEIGPVCNSTDATHFDNLNGALGSLAEVASLSQVTTSPYTLLAGFGANGVAGVKSTSGPTSQWPQILSGEGGPVAIDPFNPSNWYVNNQAGVSIHACSQSAPCTPSAFGTSPAVGESDVAGDGYTMTVPAPFIVDPLDPTQLLVGTCRIWRGPAAGGWSIANDISGFLDHVASGSFCNGNALIHSIAALPLAGGGEIIYAGMNGFNNGGGIVAGHIFSAVINSSSSAPPVWHDLTYNPVPNDTSLLNFDERDISSIFVDPHDATGATVYVTVAGIPNYDRPIRTVYRSTDAGAHWYVINAGLPWSPANDLVVDPQDAGTVYVATDAGVYFTRQIASCPTTTCWSQTPYGSGLPPAPVTQLSAAPNSVTPNVLVAGTYGRGIWQIPLLTAGTQLTSATIDPSSLDFSSEPVGSTTATQSVTVTNTGVFGLTLGTISLPAGFTETDNSQNATIGVGRSCSIQVAFDPATIGLQTGQLGLSANVPSGQLTASLAGTGLAAYNLTGNPAQLNFIVAGIGQTSDAQTVTFTNPGAASASGLALSTAAPFSILQSNCGTVLAPGGTCTASVVFSPSALGNVAGALTVNSSTFAPSSVALTGFAGVTGSVLFAPASLTFATVAVGSRSATQTVTVTNNGTEDLTNLVLTISSGFALSSTTCTSTLPIAGTCTATILFAPGAAGAISGSLSVASSALALNAQLPLTGIGFDFSVAVSGSATQAVASGQTATYALQVTPAAGASAGFSISCGSLPANSACILNPTSISVPANAAGTISIQIVTGRAVAASRTPRIYPPFAAPFLCGLLLVPAACLRRRRLLHILALVFVAITITACSGSGGGGGGTTGGGQGTNTPPGTYSIVITTTAACGLAHQTTLSLTVD